MSESDYNVLEEALRLVHGDRGEAYGHPWQDAARFAQIASAATGLDIKPEHLPVIMVAVKLSRNANSWKRDNWVDIAGYARVAEMIHEGAP